jgi:hypothetical protein
MNLPLTNRFRSLPKCFPVGAKYVVEGRGGETGILRVSARYVVLPTGRRITVAGDLERAPVARIAGLRRDRGRGKPQNSGKIRSTARSEKIFNQAGTARQRGR